MQILNFFKSEIGEEGWNRYTDKFPKPLREQMKIQYGV